MAMRKKKYVTDENYFRDLEQATDDIFWYATYVLEWDWHTLAEKANLHYATVYRLGMRITRYPRWQTFWKLATACGVSIVVYDKAEEGVVSSVADKKKHVRLVA